MNAPKSNLTDKQRAANRRMGVIMASIAVVIFMGAIARRYIFGH